MAFVLHVSLPVVFRSGQYLHLSILLQGRVSARCDRCLSFWLVEARTSWSEIVISS